MLVEQRDELPPRRLADALQPGIRQSFGVPDPLRFFQFDRACHSLRPN
jgi:hypothetical protein